MNDASRTTSAARRKTVKCEHPVCCPDLMRGLQQCEHWPDCQSSAPSSEAVASDTIQPHRTNTPLTWARMRAADLFKGDLRVVPADFAAELEVSLNAALRESSAAPAGEFACDVCGAEPGRCMTETICAQTRDTRERLASPAEGVTDYVRALERAVDAAFAFIDSHVADPDITDEMTRKHTDYMEARYNLRTMPRSLRSASAMKLTAHSADCEGFGAHPRNDRQCTCGGIDRPAPVVRAADRKANDAL